MGFLDQFFGTSQPTVNPRHRHLGAYLTAETFDDKLAAMEKYIGVYNPEIRTMKRRVAAAEHTGAERIRDFCAGLVGKPCPVRKLLLMAQENATPHIMYGREPKIDVRYAEHVKEIIDAADFQAIAVYNIGFRTRGSDLSRPGVRAKTAEIAVKLIGDAFVMSD